MLVEMVGTSKKGANQLEILIDCYLTKQRESIVTLFVFGQANKIKPLID